MNSISNHHEGAGNDAHDDNGEELLADAVWAFAMKFLNLEHDLFAPVVIFYRPAPEIEVDDLLSEKAALVKEIGQQHGDRSVRADELDDPKLDHLGFLALSLAEPLEIFVGRIDQNEVFLLTAGNEGLNGRKCGLSRTAEQKVSVVVFSEVGNQLIAGVSTIKEQHRSGGNRGQECLRFLPFRSMDTDHAPCYGQASENIVGRCDQALGKVTFPFILKATLRIKLFANLFCCRKVVLGAIEGIDRHPMPKKGWVARPEAVGQFHSICEDIREDAPGNFFAGVCKRAAVDRLRIRPKPASPCTLEEFTRFDVHPFVFPIGGQGENERNQLREGKLAVPGKISDRLSGLRGNILGDQVEKKCNRISGLA